MKNKYQFVVILSALILIVSFQSCGVESGETKLPTELDEIVEEIIISPEDSMRNLLPESIGVINDYEELFSSEQEQLLQEKIELHEALTTNEIGIVTTSSFSPYNNIDDYSLELFNTWGIGQKDKNNGVLMTVSKDSRMVRITTGTGMEMILTDSMASSINDDIMVPFFIEEDYFGGVDAGLDAIIDIIK